MYSVNMINAMAGQCMDKFLTPNQKAERENDYMFMMYFNKLINYALSMFKWTGLPDELKQHTRYMEMVLLYTGAGVMYRDEEFGKYDFLQMLPNGSFDKYGDQIKYTARGYNGYNVNLNQGNSVVFWNNYTRTADLIPMIFSFAERLADVQRTIDVRLEHHKVPVMYKGNKNNQLTLRNMFKKRQSHEPLVVTDQSLDYQEVLVQPTDPAFIIKDLWSYKKDLWNEAMLFLGVDNAKEDKKERLVTAEVEANDEQISLGRDIMLNSRLDACEEANEFFGLNMSCEFRNLKIRESEMPKSEKESEVEEDDDTRDNDTMV